MLHVVQSITAWSVLPQIPRSTIEFSCADNAEEVR